MQSADTSNELSVAINSIELLLNSKGGEFVLDAIRQYKECKTLDKNTMLKLQRNLSI